jgi:hypothetical protein
MPLSASSRRAFTFLSRASLAHVDEGVTLAWQQRRERGRVETFFPDAYHGRSAFAAGREEEMDIRVQRDADARFGRVRRTMSASSAGLIPISDTWITSQPACVNTAAVDRGKP